MKKKGINTVETMTKKLNQGMFPMENISDGEQDRGNTFLKYPVKKNGQNHNIQEVLDSLKILNLRIKRLEKNWNKH